MAPAKGASRPLTVAEAAGRFRVGYLSGVPRRNFGQHKSGWVVCDADDKNRVLTIAFDSYEVAARHRDRIAEYYRRWGW